MPSRCHHRFVVANWRSISPAIENVQQELCWSHRALQLGCVRDPTVKFPARISTRLALINGEYLWNMLLTRDPRLLMTVTLNDCSVCITTLSTFQSRILTKSFTLANPCFKSWLSIFISFSKRAERGPIWMGFVAQLQTDNVVVVVVVFFSWRCCR